MDSCVIKCDFNSKTDVEDHECHKSEEQMMNMGEEVALRTARRVCRGKNTVLGCRHFTPCRTFIKERQAVSPQKH